VFAGIGTRLAMRVTGIMAGPEAQGLVTDAGNVVGLITRDGTMFLIMFGTVAAGAASGFVHAAVRPWLPANRTALVFGMFALAIGGSSVIEASNIDFVHFGSPPVNIAMYAGLFLAGGYALHRMYGWLSRRTGKARLVLGVVALVLLVPVPMMTVGLGSELPGTPDARTIIPMLIPAALLTQWLAARRAGASANDPDAWMGARLRLAGQAIAVVAATAGALALTQEILQISREILASGS
jgi:tetrahydromethanopterin S-methyltransferase subunit F